MLRLHPQIYMPDVKEPRFFATDLQPGSDLPPSSELDTTSGSRRDAGGGYRRTLGDYLSLFEDAGPAQSAGEASPLYLVSQVAAGRIAKVQSAARIIAILREPAGFLRSLHLQWVRSHFETAKDFRSAISLEEARREGKCVPRQLRSRPQLLFYSEYVRYVEQLRRYHAVFGAEQVLVLIYDDFRIDNEGTMRRVLRFLDVDDTAPVTATEVNPSVRMRSQRLDELVHAVSVGRSPVAQAVKASVKAVVPRGLRRQMLSATQRRVVLAAPRPPDEHLTLELRRRFRSEVVALSEYLGRDLIALWGYDNVN